MPYRTFPPSRPLLPLNVTSLYAHGGRRKAPFLKERIDALILQDICTNMYWPPCPPLLLLNNQTPPCLHHVSLSRSYYNNLSHRYIHELTWMDRVYPYVECTPQLFLAEHSKRMLTVEFSDALVSSSFCRLVHGDDISSPFPG